MAFDLTAVIRLRDDISGKMRKITSQAEQMQQKFNTVGDAVKRVGDRFTDAGKKMTLGLTTPIVGVGAAAIKTVTAFDDSMAQVRAVSGATGEQFEQLRQQSLDLGATTAHSASQVANAQGYMALAGWDTNQILAATPGILSLASAAQMDLATASDIVTDQMSAFGMSADKAGIAADMFAKTQAIANTDVYQLGEALKYAGGAANAAGMDMAQTNAMLGMFANQSYKGSIGGTTFVSMLNDMRNKATDGMMSIGDMSISLYDAGGNMRSLGEIMTDVEKATDGMSGAAKDAALSNFFGVEAMKGVNAFLTEGSAKYFEMEQAIRSSSGAAEEMAKIQEDTIGGAFRSMKSALEGFMITIGDDLKGYVRAGAEAIAGLAQKFSQLDDKTRKVILVVAGVAAAIGPVVLGIGVATKAVISLVSGFNTAITVIKGLGIAMRFLATNPIGLAITAIAALVMAGVWLYRNWDIVKEKATQLGAWIAQVWDSVKGWTVNVFTSMGEWLIATWESLKNGAVEKWNAMKDGVIAIISAVSEWITSKWNAIKESITEITATIFEWVTGKFGGIKDGVTDAMETLKGNVLGVWDGIKTGIAGAVNFVIDKINGMIRGLNGLSIPLPSFMGGGEIGFSIPEIPNLPGHYHGLDYVPRDNYLARLHKGEAVLPRVEAEAYRNGALFDGVNYERAGAGMGVVNNEYHGNTSNGGDTTVNVTVNYQGGNDGSAHSKQDIDHIARELALQVVQAMEAGA